MAFLVKYLGVTNKLVDSLVNRLEKESEKMGVDLFLGNPRDPQGNQLDFVQASGLV
jgi:hypothetical protein